MQNKSIHTTSFTPNICKAHKHYISAPLKRSSLCTEMQYTVKPGLQRTL